MVLLGRHIGGSVVKTVTWVEPLIRGSMARRGWNVGTTWRWRGLGHVVLLRAAPMEISLRRVPASLSPAKWMTPSRHSAEFCNEESKPEGAD